MNYIFTKNGERKVENFIQSCIEKRKKIINEGIDTGDLVDNAGKLSINDVLLSINYFHTSNLSEYLKKERGVSVFNLGTGVNTTVLELVKAFENANNLTIPYDIQERRKGDSAICYADPSKAKEFLGWVSEKDITDMCRDSWNWQRKNPNGYDS